MQICEQHSYRMNNKGMLFTHLHSPTLILTDFVLSTCQTALREDTLPEVELALSSQLLSGR